MIRRGHPTNEFSCQKPGAAKPGTAELEDGPALPIEAPRRLACEARIDVVAERDRGARSAWPRPPEMQEELQERLGFSWVPLPIHQVRKPQRNQHRTLIRRAILPDPTERHDPSTRKTDSERGW